MKDTSRIQGYDLFIYFTSYSFSLRTNYSLNESVFKLENTFIFFCQRYFSSLLVNWL